MTWTNTAIQEHIDYAASQPQFHPSLGFRHGKPAPRGGRLPITEVLDLRRYWGVPINSASSTGCTCAYIMRRELQRVRDGADLRDCPECEVINRT